MITQRPVLKLGKDAGGGRERISIGSRTLEQHLLEADICQPLYINELLSAQDWSLFEDKYPSKGRKPYKPQSMTGLILYGLMQGISSLRDLARMARVDLGCIYLTNGIFPDSSSISRFITRHQDILTEEFFIHLTRSILKITRTGIRSLAGDGTIIEAAASRYSLMRQEAIEEKKKEARTQSLSDPANKAKSQKLEQMEQASNELQARIDKRKEQHKPTETATISPTEPEAVTQPTKKGKTPVPAYKPSVLANDARIVVSLDVHPSNEIKSLFTMLDMTSKMSDEKVEELLLDGGYESIDVMKECIERNISMLCTRGKKKKKT